MSPYFYLLAVLLVIGFGGSIIGFIEWAYHRYEKRSVFLWALGLLLLNWYQLPTLLSFSGQEIVLADYRILFSFAILCSFLGLQLIYLGGRAILGPIRVRSMIVLFLWFIAAALFYGLYYGNPARPPSIMPAIVSNLLFAAPMFLLNALVGIALIRRALAVPRVSLRIGSIVYFTAAAVGFIRVIISVTFVMTHPPAFAILRFFSPPVIILQTAGVTLFVISFFFLHKHFEELEA